MIPAFLSGLNPDGTTYVPDSRWAIYASHIETGGSRYMSRWIVQTPWGGLRLHRIHRADADDHPHDHPFDFTSLILAGGYTEEREFRTPDDAKTALSWGDSIRGRRIWRAFVRGDFISRKATDFHRLIYVAPSTWTLVWFGPKRQSWGFLTADGKIPWRRYLGLESQ